MRPFITAEQRERVLGYVERGRTEGARHVVGARAIDDRGPGFYVEPTLFADVDPAAAIAQEEILGPVFSLIAYEDEDDAVRIANDTVDGLAGHVWGADPNHAVGVARRLRTGMVAVNGGTFIGAQLPFGGRRQSGIGREWGVAGFEQVLKLKTIGVGASG